jgi:hypothetical protein
MANYTQNLIAKVEQINGDVRESFGELSAEQLNWKPDEKSWSVGQCFDHLIVGNRSMLSKIIPIIEGRHKTTFFERMPLMPKLFGGLVLKAVEPGNPGKTKNPAIFNPSQSGVGSDVIQTFLDGQITLLDTLQGGGSVDLTGTVMTSPVAAFITYSLLDGFRIIVTHEQRHVIQAKRVTEMKEFPTGG